ncbi:MAG: FliM/FliN family flagellar motor switch protein [Pseudomonadota bacterium]|nr:FliM/FliN family flagellar motor switch protein [Pseudomonadota bacterium]
MAPVFTEVLGSAARRLRAKLASRSGRDSPVVVGAPDACSLADLVATVPAGRGLWCAFPVPAGGPPALVLVEAELLSGLIGQLFGAPAGDTAPGRGGGLTEVEQAVGARMCRELIDSLLACWAGSPAPRLTVGEVAPSPRVCAGLDPMSAYVAVPMEIGPLGVPLGTLFVALPAAIVPGVAPLPAPPPPELRVVSARRPPQYDRVLPVEVDFVAELARMTVSLRTLRSLAVGDELPLPTSTEVMGRVGGLPAFFGEAGTQGGVRSLRVTRRANSASSQKVDDR